jgi:hypothetical protein
MTTREDGFKRLHVQIQELINANVHKRAAKTVRWNESGDRRLMGPASKGSGLTSNRTREIRADDIHRFFRELHELGFNIIKAENIGEKHIVALVMKWDAENQANSTITNKLSSLRGFCKWIGKVGLVKSTSHYFPDRAERHNVTRIATEVKTPEALGHNFAEVLREADALDARLGLILRLSRYFGLRAKETLMFRAHTAMSGFSESRVVRLSKYSGAKGGRPREVLGWPGESIGDIEFRVHQDETVALAKRVCGHSGAVGWFDGQEDGLKRSAKALYRRCASLGVAKSKLGFTLHDLRKAYAIDLMIAMGFTPPLVGGDLTESVEIRIAAIDRVMHDLGHNDQHTSGAYVGGISEKSIESLKEAARQKFLRDLR